MKRNRREWTDAVRDAVRDAEAMPPAAGWERLSAVLSAAAGDAARAGSAGVAPSRWRLYRQWAASVAAAAVAVAAGSYLWWAAGRLPGGGLPVADPVAAVLGQEVTDAPLVAAAAPEPGHAGAFGGPLSPAVLSCGTDAADGPAPRGVAGREVPVRVDRAFVGGEEPAAGRADGPDDGQTQEPEAAGADSPAAGRAAVVPDGRPRTCAGIGRSRGPVAAQGRRASLAVHAAGLPNVSRSGGDLPPMSDDRAPVGSAMQFAHAPADVMDNVVRGTVALPRPAEYRHLQPVSVGLAVRYGFPHGLSLASGVNYTLLRSEARIEGRGGWVDQRLHFIGIPLRLDWQYLERGCFSLYIGAGGQVEKCVAARLDGLSVSEPGVQWSLAAAAGAQCGLGGVVALYAEPELAWYVNSTRLATSRTDHPLAFTLRLGVRFSF